MRSSLCALALIALVCLVALAIPCYAASKDDITGIIHLARTGAGEDITVHLSQDGNEGKMSVDGLPDGDYEITFYKTGDLLVSTWDKEHDIKFAVSFTMPDAKEAIDVPNGLIQLKGDNSLIGLGALINVKEVPAVIARGVVGINNPSAKTRNNGPGYSANVATCKLRPVPNAPFKVTGEVIFKRGLSATHVNAKIVGLQGNAMYGFHIHEYGDLGGADGMTTKGHYNPHGTTHKLPGGAQFGHVGDMGNIAFYDNAGVAWFDERNISVIRLAEDNVNILGRAVVVHSQMDNGCDQPTGGAGSRIAFCVIGLAANDKTMPALDFIIPAQRGSTGCSLDNSPTVAPRSSSFIWVTVVICLALAGIGGLFAYNWWRAKNNPTAHTAANGRQPWYAHQNEDDSA